MSRHFLSKRDIKAFREKFADIPIDFDEFNRLEIDESGKITVYYYRKRPYFFDDGRLIPTLYLLNAVKPERNRITVDKGAVPHVAKGAGIFIRGILDADPGIVKDDMLFIRNEDGVYISVGLSNTDTNTLLSKSDGEGIRNLHYLEDEIMKSTYS